MGERARTPVILGGGRTPIGRFLGGLSPLAAPELGGIAIRAALERSGVDPTSVDEVIMGNVVVAGEGQAPARQAAMSGGVPATVPAVTVNKVCGSGLKAVMLAAQAVRAGDAQVVVAGGMESMSNVPHYVRGLRSGVKLGDQTLQDGLVLDGLWCAFGDCHMGGHAEYTAAKDGGKFEQEIVAVSIETRRGTTVVDSDEGPRRDTSLEALGKLRPAFGADAPDDIEELVVTAGNAPGLNDGAAAIVVASLEFAQAQGIPVRAEVSAYAAAGADPRDLFFAPIAAAKNLMEKEQTDIGDYGLVELNEAFAVQALADMRGLDMDPERVNVHGGAVALGHPIGASGARILVTLLGAMEDRDVDTGLATLCLGGGNAVALSVRRT